LLLGVTEYDDSEAHEMTTLLTELTNPHRRDEGALVRGRAGIWRQAADGLIVRVAAAETAQDAEAVQRELFALACRDAAAK
jgi:hypothetical protein